LKFLIFKDQRPKTKKTTNNEPIKIMLRALFLIFGMGVVLLYAVASFMGWEFANAGSRSVTGVPFIYSGGFRGGK
jgi:high-affinity K+ transport system ATPase subunit B